MDSKQEENRMKKHWVASKQKLMKAGQSVLTSSSALPRGFSLGDSWVGKGKHAPLRRWVGKSFKWKYGRF